MLNKENTSICFDGSTEVAIGRDSGNACLIVLVVLSIEGKRKEKGYAHLWCIFGKVYHIIYRDTQDGHMPSLCAYLFLFLISE